MNEIIERQVKEVSKDFKINKTTGEAYISIRKTAELLQMPDTTLRDYLKSAHPRYDRKQGLTPELLQNIVNFRARQGSEVAFTLLEKLAEAGAKAFIYHQAGYVVSAKPTKLEIPTNYVAQLKQLILLVEENEKLEGEIKNNERVIFIQKETIETKKVITNESSEYYSINRVKKLNLDSKFSGQILSKVSMDEGYTVEHLYVTYDNQHAPQVYHKDIWVLVYPDAILPEDLK